MFGTPEMAAYTILLKQFRRPCGIIALRRAVPGSAVKQHVVSQQLHKLFVVVTGPSHRELIEFVYQKTDLASNAKGFFLEAV